MARSYCRFSVLALLFASILACSPEVREIQYSLRVGPVTKDDAILLRSAVEKFSTAEGYIGDSQMETEKMAEAEGTYWRSFNAADRSFISFTNYADKNCYDVAVHSHVNAAAAKATGERLKQILHATIPSDMAQDQSCKIPR